MALFVNFTPYAVAECSGLERDGSEWYALVAKATFTWGADGRAEPCPEPRPVAEEDVYAGAPGDSSVVMEADLVPEKPKLDVVLLGHLEAAQPVERLEATLELGARLKKSVRVVGERVWVKSLGSVLLSHPPVPFTRMPLLWERSFGGADAQAPGCVERRNPFGTGMAERPEHLVGTRAPNFEAPAEPLKGPRDRPAPVGFGPVARHALPRVGLAGTYDARWQESRFPLLPEDFRPAFYNCAPADQQAEAYLPGEEVRLTGMTPAGRERFFLPDWRVPVAGLLRNGEALNAVLAPDTLIIEPAERRFSLVGRVCLRPQPDVLALRQVRVGVPSRGWQRAQQTGKQLVGLGERRGVR